MIDEIAKVSPVSGTGATRKDWSTSIESEPDRAWVAERQDQITGDLQRLNERLAEERHAEVDDERPAGHGADRRGQSEDPDEAAESEPRLSGESLCIGEGNLEEDVPFGQHVGFV